jgi:predicted AAA+ superfamily ATPase
MLLRQAKLWPVVGLVGLRQSGKTTLLRDQLSIENFVTLDDDDNLVAALASPKIFLARQQSPTIIDEVQKAPKLFDAIKLSVDRQRRPGQFYITGSSQFSSRLGIRESLTGRIGICQLFPLTLAEANQNPKWVT